MLTDNQLAELVTPKGVASVALCKDLFACSGWKGEHGYQLIETTNPHTGKVLRRHATPYVVSLGYINDQNRGECVITPLYDAGYLMRMLPSHTVQKMGGEVFVARWEDLSGRFGLSIERSSRTSPENALCRLAIALFEAGVLMAPARTGAAE